MHEPFTNLEKRINIFFNDKQILKIALTHRSYHTSKGHVKKHNERIEFLGDAVLEIIVTDYLFSHFPNHSEGELTSFRSALVKTESLSNASRSIELPKYIFMSSGEEATGGRNRSLLLANTFEALIGAIYLDSGYNKAKDFVIKILIPQLDDIIKYRLDIDNKTKLQQITQEILNITPTYKILRTVGPDHNKKFTVALFLNNIKFEEGEGSNKQEAEQIAAKNTLLKFADKHDLKKYYLLKNKNTLLKSTETNNVYNK